MVHFFVVVVELASNTLKDRKRDKSWEIDDFLTKASLLEHHGLWGFDFGEG